jgi:hypothetical protein
MKKNVEEKPKKKLVLNKQTVSTLASKELSEIKAGACDPCWENLWTLYYCKVIYTGPPEQ